MSEPETLEEERKHLHVLQLAAADGDIESTAVDPDKPPGLVSQKRAEKDRNNYNNSNNEEETTTAAISFSSPPMTTVVLAEGSSGSLQSDQQHKTKQGREDDDNQRPDTASTPAAVAGTGARHSRRGERDSSAGPFVRNNNNKNKKWIQCDRVWVFALVIVAVGVAVSCAFLLFGINAAREQDTIDFERSAQELIGSIQVAWGDFEVAGLYIHNACRGKPGASATYLERGICSRDDFDDLYKNVEFSGLDVQAVCLAVNATQADRLDLEAESYQYYADKNLTDFEYNGFIGFEPDPSSPRGVSVRPSPENDYYYAVHLCAPLTGYNLNALDFDIRTSPPRQVAMENALRTRKPALTDRVVLLGDVAEIDGYSVIIMHPGITEEQPDEVSLVVVRIRSLLLRAARTQASSSTLVMYDTTNKDEEAHFLGGLDIKINPNNERIYTYTAEIDVDSVRRSAPLLWEETIFIADREWHVLVTQQEEPAVLYVIIASVIIFAACICLAAWYFTSARREERMHALKAASEAEKASLILENAEKAAAHERELVNNCTIVAYHILKFIVVRRQNLTLYFATSLLDFTE